MRTNQFTRSGLALTGLVLSVAGCSTGSGQPPHITIPPATAPVPARTPPVGAVEPDRLVINAIGVDAPLDPLGLDPKGHLAEPDLAHADRAAWYCDGHNEIGDRAACAKGVVLGEHGPGVIWGHVDSHGREGVFFRLKKLVANDQIQVRRVDGSTLTFKVTKVESVPKNRFPSADVYHNTPDAELVLITCTGLWTGNPDIGYADNEIVRASLVATE